MDNINSFCASWIDALEYLDADACFHLALVLIRVCDTDVVLFSSHELPAGTYVAEPFMVD